MCWARRSGGSTRGRNRPIVPEITREFLLGIAPREIRVRLREAELASRSIGFGRVNASAKEDHARVHAFHLGDEPLPERERLRVRIVDAEDLDALGDPMQDDALEFAPERAPIVALEIERIDVLIFLGRILGVLHAAVGTVLEPGRDARPRKDDRAHTGKRGRARCRSRGARPRQAGGESLRAFQVPAESPCDPPRPRRSPKDFRRRLGLPRAGCCLPLRLMRPIGWIGGKYSTSKPISARYGNLSATSRNVPCLPGSAAAERGNISYQVLNSARLRSATSSNASRTARLRSACRAAASACRPSRASAFIAPASCSAAAAAHSSAAQASSSLASASDADSPFAARSAHPRISSAPTNSAMRTSSRSSRRSSS